MSFAFGAAGGGGFGGGATSAFGGGGNAFGAAPAATNAAASPFGGGGNAGGFGAAAAPSAFGGFGSAMKPAATGFGAPSAFGAAPATGGGMFGAQQPAAAGGFGAQPSTGGGLFGNAAASPGGAFGVTTPTATTGFGGATPNTAGAFGGGGGFGATTGFGAAPVAGGFGTNAAASPFGAMKPAVASPFGQTSAFGAQQPQQQSAFGGGGSSAFGTPAPTGASVFGGGGATSAFGAKSPSPFGGAGGGGAFGAPAAQQQGAFGGFNASPAVQQQPQQPQVGTGMPPWEISRENDGAAGMSNFIAISRMQAYAHKSMEELRWEDYLKRTNPQEAATIAALNQPQAAAVGTPTQQGFGFGGAGAATGFGGAATSSAGFGASFGSTTSTAPSSGGFGSFTAQPATGGSLFGSTTRSIGGFGTTQTQQTSAFGAPATQTTGAFGAPAAGGFGAAGTSTFGGGFGAPTAQPAGGGFGGFGATNTTSAFGAGAGGFGKPAATGGFGGFSTQAPAQAAGGFSFGGQNAAATQQQPAGGSLFGGAAATGTSAFTFNSAQKPATSGGFGGFGATTTATSGGFGATTGGFGGGGGGFGATSGFGTNTGGGFGTNTAQPAGGTSLFGGATGGFGGGFNTGATAGQATGGTSLFGNTQKTGASLFGNTTATSGATSGGLFGSTTTGGTSLFGGGGAAAKPSTGFNFGGGGGLTSGATTTGGFGGFGSSFGAGGAATTGGGFGGGGLFGSAQTAAPAMQVQAAQPTTLVATPDVNPYGAGAFGAGLVEQNVKAALDLQSLKPSTSAASRLSSFAQDVGLPRGAMENSVASKRNLLSSTRHSIPVSFIREAGFKGSKSRFSTITSTSSSSSSNALRPSSAEQVSSGTREDEFKFSSSLFRNSVAKRLVINRPEQRQDSFSSARPVGARASVVPFADEEPANVRATTSNSLLKPDDEGYLSVVFRTLLNKKSFTLRLKAGESIKSARDDVKRLLRSTMSSSVCDVQLLANGRVLHDTTTIGTMNLREGDVVDVAVVEDLTEAAKAPSVTTSKTTPAPVEAKLATASRFMSYSEFLNSAIREEEESAVLDSSKPLAASCPSLKNPDYYTVPSYDRLKRMSDVELSAVENFIVGCKGLGSVEWIGHIDVRNLDLDELIHFEKKEVIVYKDDENKHELGTGLNRPAIVELLGIFPPRKVQDPEAYKEKVKQRTRDIGSTYVDYSPATGIWRFRVEHFSRYGLDDDEDDEDMDKESAQAAGFRDQKTAAKMAVPKHAQAPGQSRTFISSDRLNLVRNSAMYRSHTQVSSASVATFRDADDEMQAEDFQSASSTLPPSAPAYKSQQANENEEEEEAPEPTVVNVATSIVFPVSPDILRLQPLGIDTETSLLPRGSKSVTYQMFLQVTGQTHVAKNHTDMGLFLARSFRCSWGPNGQLVNIARPVACQNGALNNLGRQVTVEYPLQPPATPSKINKDALELHYQCCQLSSVDDDCEDLSPVRAFALPSDDDIVSCLRKYVEFADRVRQQHPQSHFYRRTALLWKLIQALWGQEHDVAELNSSQFCPLAARDDPREIENMETFQMVDLRREAISRWFEAALVAETQGDHVETSEAGILKLLCQHRIVEASEMAIECGDFRLATLLAQAASYEGADFRSLLADQLSQWSENGTLEFVEEDVVMIYSLLAGSVEVLTSQKEDSVSWVASLALFFWYKRGPATSLKMALTLYREAVTNQRAKAPLAQTGKKDDVLMEVMKLYVEDAVSLCSVLSPTGFAADSPVSHLDYELSWHLHSVLRAIGFRIDRKWESHLHHNYIRQLEGAGLWEQALYVALNISDADERVASTRQLVLRNADVLKAVSSAKRVELCDKYGLPMEWIEEALAMGAVSRHAHREEIAHWMAARQFEDAHACLTRHIAPMCIFSGEKSVLVQLLEELEPSAALIPQWHACCANYIIGGGLLLEYLRLETQDGLEVGHEQLFLDRLLQLAEKLAHANGAADVGGSTTFVKRDRALLVARTALSSMLVALSTRSVQLCALLEATTSNKDEETMEEDDESVPLQLRADFLTSLSNLSRGRETKFVESYRASQLLNLCASFVDWRA